MNQSITNVASPALANQNKLRLITFFVLLTIGVYWLTSSVYLLLFLIIDFALRAFHLGKYSSLAFISERLVKLFHVPVVKVYFPPKRFAARIGLLFCCALLVLQLFGINTYTVSGVLALFAALESLFGFCAGCYVYSFTRYIKRTYRKN